MIYNDNDDTLSNLGKGCLDKWHQSMLGQCSLQRSTSRLTVGHEFGNDAALGQNRSETLQGRRRHKIQQNAKLMQATPNSIRDTGTTAAEAHRSTFSQHRFSQYIFVDLSSFYRRCNGIGGTEESFLRRRTPGLSDFERLPGVSNFDIHIMCSWWTRFLMMRSSLSNNLFATS